MSTQRIERLAAEMVAEFGIGASVGLVELAKQAKLEGDEASLERLVQHCRDAGIIVDRPLCGTQQGFGFDTTHGFLGEEFLTWLWFRWETQGGEFTLKRGRIVGVALDDFLAFAALSEDETEQTLRRGLPTRTDEARAALRQGHRLRKARLLVAEHDRQWSLVLDGELMQFSSVKLPEDAEECESATDRTADRAANWLALHELLSALYGRFIEVRCSEDWSGEAEAMANWMAR